MLGSRFMNVSMFNALRKLLEYDLEQKADQDKYTDIIIIPVVSIRYQVQNSYAEKKGPAERQDKFQCFMIVALKEKSGHPAGKGAQEQHNYFPGIHQNAGCSPLNNKDISQPTNAP